MRLIQAGSGVIEIALSAEFTGTCGEELSDTIKTSDPSANRLIILDFSGVAFFDNTALDILVKLHSVYAGMCCSLYAVGLSQHYREVLTLAGLDRAFHTNSSDSKVIRAARTTDVTQAVKPEPLDVQYWAAYVERLEVTETPPGAINLNVNGRRTAGPVQGFGRLWEKIYTLNVSEAKMTAQQIIDLMKNNFTALQPEENRFYPANGIKQGEIVLINASTPGGLIATGVFILYAGPDTFTFITPQGHPEAGWVTFRSFSDRGLTFVQIRSLARASDPIYETAFRIAGSALQERIWTHVLESLASLTGVPSTVQFNRHCLDYSLHWSRSFNVLRNAQVISLLYSITHPLKNK